MSADDMSLGGLRGRYVVWQELAGRLWGGRMERDGDGMCRQGVYSSKQRMGEERWLCWWSEEKHDRAVLLLRCALGRAVQGTVLLG